MTAAAVAEAELADIDVGGLVEYRLADHNGGVLLAEAPCDVHGDLCVRVEGVDHEAVAGVDYLLVAQVEHDDLAVHLRDALKLRLEELRLLAVKVGAFFDVRQREDLVDRVVHAVADQFHHQVVVGDAEIAESAEPGAGVHDEVQQHPALGTKHLVEGEIRAVALVDGFHQLVADARERRLAAVVVVDDARGAAGVRVDDELAAGLLRLEAVDLRLVVVEGDRHAGIVGQVGRDVVFREFDLAVLDVLGVDELDLVDHIELAEHHCAGESVEVAARNKSHFLIHNYLRRFFIYAYYSIFCLRFQ